MSDTQLILQDEEIKNVLDGKNEKFLQFDKKKITEKTADFSSTVEIGDPTSEVEPEKHTIREKDEKKKVKWPDQADGNADSKFITKVIGDSGISRKQSIVIDDEASGMKGWWREQWSDSDSFLRRSISIVALVILAFGGAGIFYAIEQKELGYNYWRALSYVNSIYTTIGM